MNDINVILADYPGVGRVRLCECNSIHLTLGPVTVSFTPQAFAQAAALIRGALEQLTVAGSEQTRHGAFDALEPHPGQLTH